MSELKTLKGIDELERRLQKIDALMLSGQVIEGWRSLRSILADLKVAKDQIIDEKIKEESK